MPLSKPTGDVIRTGDDAHGDIPEALDYKPFTPDVGEESKVPGGALHYWTGVNFAYKVGGSEFLFGASSGVAASVEFTRTQNGHGFAVGQVIYFDGANWSLAQADTENTAGMAIVDSVPDANNFGAVMSGFINSLAGLTPGGYYYVSTGTPGAITTTKPTTGFSRPILRAESATTGFVLPYGPEDLEEIHTHENASEGGQLDINLATFGTLLETRGGTNQTTYATGDILYSDGVDSLAKLPAGTDGQFLSQVAGIPSWQDPAATDWASVLVEGRVTGGAGTNNPQIASGDVIEFARTQVLSLDALAQTVGAGLAQIPDLAGATDQFVMEDVVQTLTNKTLAGATLTGDLIVADTFGAVIGNSSQETIGSIVPEFQVLGTADVDSNGAIGRWSADEFGPVIKFTKSRNAAIGGNTIVADGDEIGTLEWYPNDGVGANILSARFSAVVRDLTGPVAGDVGMNFVWESRSGEGEALQPVMILQSGSLTLRPSANIIEITDDNTTLDIEMAPFVTEGNGFRVSYDSPTVLTGPLFGFNIDLGTNVTKSGANTTGFRLAINSPTLLGPHFLLEETSTTRFATFSRDVGGAGLKIFGDIGTSGEEIILRGTGHPDLGLVRLQSPIVFDDVTAANALSPYSVADTSTQSFSAAFIGGTYNASPTIDFSFSTFIWEALRGAPNIQSLTSPAFAAFTLFQALPLLRAGPSASDNVLQMIIMNAGGTAQNEFGSARTIANMTTIGHALQMKTTVSGATLTAGATTGLSFAPKWSTVVGSTVDFGPIRGIHAQNPGPALFAPSAGTEQADEYIAVDMDNITITTSGDVVTVRSALVPAADHYFLLNNGGAQMDLGSGDILHTGDWTTAFTHTGATFGIFDTTPATQPPAYTPTNVTTTRSFDADSVTLDTLADVVGTLIQDIQTWGGVG